MKRQDNDRSFVFGFDEVRKRTARGITVRIGDDICWFPLDRVDVDTDAMEIAMSSETARVQGLRD